MESKTFVRINGEMLKSLRGSSVCVLGRFKKLSSDQQSFEMETCDGKTITCKLKSPIKDMLTEIVEVYGEIDEKCNIYCSNYCTFDSSLTSNFDMDMYNESIKMINQLPKHYIQASS